MSSQACIAIYTARIDVGQLYTGFNMQALTCTEHDEDFDIREAIDHVRRFHASFIKRPGRAGEIDAHNHMWYCFYCSTSIKDHRSYDSDNAIWTHLRHNHDSIVNYIISSEDADWELQTDGQSNQSAHKYPPRRV